MSEAQQCDELTHAMERMRTDVERGFSTLLPLVSSTEVTCIRGNLQRVRSAVSSSNGVTVTGDYTVEELMTIVIHHKHHL